MSPAPRAEPIGVPERRSGWSPEPPGVVGLFVTCIGTGVILAAVACGVVIAFFQESGSMEPLPGERPAVKANAAREQAD